MHVCMCVYVCVLGEGGCAWEMVEGSPMNSTFCHGMVVLAAPSPTTVSYLWRGEAAAYVRARMCAGGAGT
jgi:hypothetical protein